MQFIKKKIPLFVNYFAIVLCFLLYKLFYFRQLFKLTKRFKRFLFYFSRVLNDFLKHLKILYDNILQ